MSDVDNSRTSPDDARVNVPYDLFADPVAAGGAPVGTVVANSAPFEELVRRDPRNAAAADRWP
jgi:hypothetical protein